MNFGIIGHGRFGKVWAEALAPFGEVSIFDKNLVLPLQGPSLKACSLAEAAQADCIFILVPISEFEASCREIKPFLKPTSLIVDACSVKMYPVRVMQSVFSDQQPFLASHPLFGPDSVKKSNGLAGHKIVVCAARGETAKQQQLMAIFKKMGLHVLLCTPEDHDLQMAISQGLVHFIGRGLAALNMHEQDIATPDFKALLSINTMVVNDSWQLFLDMQRYNPYTKDIRTKLIDQLIKINAQIEDERPEGQYFFNE